jgi:Leucine-rich repeat (LRR) protein
MSNYWGYASDGEVEDYTVSIHEAYDWGDAPDPTFPTLAASNGARHKIVPGFYLGYGVDPDVDGQPQTGSVGDDWDGNDDEDGWLLGSQGYWFPGQQVTINILASAAGMLDAWLDFALDGSWAEPEDQIFTSEPLVAGVNQVSFTIDPSAKKGVAKLRLRFSSQGGLSYNGPADDGEVEDHEAGLGNADFGDAPDGPYPTLMANNGAFSLIHANIYLGYIVDGEMDGQPDADALGDDNDGSNDDDGVIFLPILVGQECDVEVTAPNGGYLHAWIDFNGNGSWEDAGEKIFDDVNLSGGMTLLPYDVPATAVEGITYARFHLMYMSIPGHPPGGEGSMGEIEDYKVEIQPSSQSTVNDSLILVELYNSTDGPNWTANTNWLTGPLATWYGVTLAQIPVNVWRVTDLQLYSNNLVGTLPSSLGNLNELDSLLLYANDLSGPIPPELGNLANLTHLDLSSNQLTGPIPVELGNLSNLNVLGLYNNQLDGSIPVELGQLSLLTRLWLAENDLTGPVPSWLGTQLTQLEALYLYDNQLTGPIPPELGNLANLRELSLRINMLDGSIPVELGNLSQLEWLNIRNNQLTGQIPQQLGNLSNLQLFRCDNNQLNGQIPNQLGNMSSITTFRCDYNQLSGAIPGSIQNLTTLVNMRLNDNQFTDLPDLSPLVNLMNLTAENNQFTFEDIEPNVGVPSNSFTYSPQADVGTVQDETINAGDNLTLTVTVGGTSNHYQWMKDNVDIPGAVSSSYDIVSAQASDAGIYVCKITNAIATALTLTSKPITVTVSGTGIEEKAATLPETMALYQNYPNPFNPSTTIDYQMPHTAEVTLTIYDVNGHLVRQLVRGVIPAGYHSAPWDGTDDTGKAVASGMYFYRINIKTIGAKQSSYVAVKRLILMK